VSIVMDYYYDEGGNGDTFCYFEDVLDNIKELDDWVSWSLIGYFF
jgi:hypothetical protein